MSAQSGNRVGLTSRRDAQAWRFLGFGGSIGDLPYGHKKAGDGLSPTVFMVAKWCSLGVPPSKVDARQ